MHDTGLLYEYLAAARVKEYYRTTSLRPGTEARWMESALTWVAGRLRWMSDALDAWAKRPASPAHLDRLAEERQRQQYS